MQSYIRVLLWPIVLIAALVMFRTPLSGLIDRLTNVNVDMNEDGMTIALVAANIGAAEASRAGSTADVREPIDLKGIASAATRAAGSPAVSQAKVMWVDDNPANNQYERNALQALGLEFTTATNTEDALEGLKVGQYDLIITDFKREDDPQAAYTLLDALKTLPSAPPLIIYSSAANPDFEQAAKSRGAYGETNSPQRLFDLSINAILGK